jgi:hypothetical protein
MGFFGSDGVWLFPITYLLHILEEALAGERFHFWVRQITGRTMSSRTFYWLNALFLALMVVAVALVRSRQAAWLIPAMGFCVSLNGFGHLAGALVSRSYSPGLGTGVLLWIPLGIVSVLGSAVWLTPGGWLRGLAAGVSVSLLVFGLGFGLSVRATDAPERRR